MPFDCYPVCEYTRIEVTANEPEDTAVRDPLSQSSHQHVVVHSIEEFLQINVHDIAAAFLHIGASATHSIVRPPARPKAVAGF
jgi:hypothetical protein